MTRSGVPFFKLEQLELEHGTLWSRLLTFFLYKAICSAAKDNYSC